jgi:hypothetical protein
MFAEKPWLSDGLEPGRSGMGRAVYEKRPLRPLGKKTPVAFVPEVVAFPPVTMLRT